MGKILKTGAGWRLGWDAEALEFKALVGADDWAIELTEPEFDDFCRLVGQLGEAMRAIASELMDEEKISCELESDLIWLEAEGFPDAYSLRLIVRSPRRAEGFWSFTAVLDLLQTLPLLKIF
jgi:Domain of unknown function (DUF1818)